MNRTMTITSRPDARPAAETAHSLDAASANEAHPPGNAADGGVASQFSAAGGELQSIVVSRNPRPPSMQTLAPDELRQVTRYATTQELAALAGLSKGMRSSVAKDLEASKLAHAASRVNTAADFHAVLGDPAAQIGDASNTIRSLPHGLRSEPLATLALRLHALPSNDILQLVSDDVRQAFADFRSAVAALSEQDRTDTLTELDRIAQHGPGRQGATDAANAGENVQLISRFHGGNEFFAADLEYFARTSLHKNSARSAVLRGESVAEVARLCGITSSYSIEELEALAITSNLDGSAGRLVRDGMNVQEVARLRGITTDRGVCLLELESINSSAQGSAGGAVREGKLAAEIANECGIDTGYGRSLLQQSVDGHARSVGALIPP
jgi:hypothetical protein